MNSNFTAYVGAKISEFRRKMTEVNKIASKTASKIEKPIDANTRSFDRKYAELKAKMMAIRDGVTVKIKASTSAASKAVNKFGGNLMDLSDKYEHLSMKIRAVGTIGQSFLTGFATSISATAVPAVASLAGAIGSLGPVLAVAAGGATSLGVAFSAAGVGAAAFGAIAVSNLNNVFDANKKIGDLQDKIDVEKDATKRAKLLQQQADIMGSLNKQQLKAYNSMQNLKKVWSGITKPLEGQTINIFAKSLDALSTILNYLRPTFQNATTAVDHLVDSFNKFLKLDDVHSFFVVLGKSVGPAMETLGKAGMNVMRGLMNLFVAFQPLSVQVQNGFLGMTESFAKWSQNVANSKGFQSFINYITVNGPKILQIIGNIAGGLIGMFKSFAPTASGMLDGLVKITAQFKAWGQALSSNTQFQSFIAYIQANAPKVVSLIGNLGKLILTLAAGFAPLGSAILSMLVPFTAWLNSFLKAHPTITKVVAVIVALTGVLISLAPQIIAVKTLFGGMGPVIARAATAILSFSKKTIISMGQMIVSAAKTATAFVVNATKIVAQWALMAAKSALNAARVAGAWLLTTGSAAATAVASMIATAATFVARWVFMGAQTLVQAARMAAAWFIALGPIGWVAGAIVGIAVLVIANWKTVKKWTIAAWGAVGKFLSGLWNGIKKAASVVWGGITAYFNWVLGVYKSIFKTAWNAIKSFLAGLWRSVASIGKSIWNGLKSSISSIVKGTAFAIRNAWNTAKSWTSSLFGNIWGVAKKIWGSIRSSIGGFLSSIVSHIKSGWNSAKSNTSRLIGQLKDAAIEKFLGIVDWVTGFPGRVGNAIANNVKNAVGGVKKLAKTLVDKFKSFLGIHSPSKVFQNLGHYVVQGLVNGLSGGNLKSLGTSVLKDFGGGAIKGWNNVKSFFSGLLGGGDGGGKNVTGWLTAALGATGTSMSWLPGLQKLVKAESGGNPRAQNPITVMGQHATGLMQMLPSTFAANAVKGMSNILNPVHNAAAAINYIKRRYGSVFNTPLFAGGPYKGYASGGTPSHEWAIVGERGPELVRFGNTSRVFNNNETMDMLSNTDIEKQPAVINIQVGTRTLAKAIIDDINKLQDKQVDSRAVFG